MNDCKNCKLYIDEIIMLRKVIEKLKFDLGFVIDFVRTKPIKDK